jgi:transposase
MFERKFEHSTVSGVEYFSMNVAEEELEKLRRENRQLREENEWLRKKIDAMARRYFGKKSEQLNEGQLEFLMDQLAASEKSVAEEEPEESAKQNRPRPRKPRKPRIPDHLPVVEETLEPEEVIEDPDAYRKIGQEVSEQFDYDPGRLYRRRVIRPIYVKRNDPDAAPFNTELPPKLLERGILAPGLLAHVLVSKYADHLPLDRQAKIFMQRYGVDLSRQTLCRGVELCADWLKPIVREIIRNQIRDGYLQIDETPIKYLTPGKGKTSQGYFWTVHAPGKDTVYHWKPGRGHQHLLKLLPKEFAGIVQCDAFSAYATMVKKRRNVELAGCWAHVRRKFYEAFEQKESPEENGWILKQIGELYRIEKQLRESRAGPDERQAVRLRQSRPILERLHSRLKQLLEERSHLPQSLTGRAVKYALGQWELLTKYVEDGRVEIDNNLVENKIRPTALGKKNWLFIGAEGAGWRSAVIFTLIACCKTHGVEPYEYLKDVLTRLPGMTNQQVHTITPKAWAESRQISPETPS